MSSRVAIVVIIPAIEPDGVKAVARRFLEDAVIPTRPPPELRVHAVEESQRLLEDVASGKAYSTGRRGGHFVWSTVTDHLDVYDFVNALAPFWQELFYGFGLHPRWRGPHPDSTITVLYEWDYAEFASAVQVRLVDSENWPDSAEADSWRPELAISTIDPLPFSLY